MGGKWARPHASRAALQQGLPLPLRARRPARSEAHRCPCRTRAPPQLPQLVASGAPEPLRTAVATLRLLCRIFYSLNSPGLTPVRAALHAAPRAARTLRCCVVPPVTRMRPAPAAAHLPHTKHPATHRR